MILTSQLDFNLIQGSDYKSTIFIFREARNLEVVLPSFLPSIYIRIKHVVVLSDGGRKQAKMRNSCDVLTKIGRETYHI